MTSRNRNTDEAIVSLLYLLPPEITELWWDTVDLTAFLRCGGVSGITPEQLRKAIVATERFRAATPWKCRRWRNSRYYLFGDAMDGFTPKTQYNHFMQT